PRRTGGRIARGRLYGAGRRTSSAERSRAGVRAARRDAQAGWAARRRDDQPAVADRAPKLLRGPDARTAPRSGDAGAARSAGGLRGDGDSVPERARGAADRAGRSGDRRERPASQRAPLRAAGLRARGTNDDVIRIHTFATLALQTRTTFQPALSVGGSGGIPFVGREPRDAVR